MIPASVASIAPSKPNLSSTIAPPMLPIASAPALAAENSAKALPRSASRLRREISTSIGVMTSPPPKPVRVPAIIKRGVVGGRVSTSTAIPVAARPVMIRKIGGIRSASQPDGTRDNRIATPSATKKRQQIDGDQRGPGASEREPEASPRDAGRAVVFGTRLAGRLEPERHEVDDRQTEQDKGDGHDRDPMEGRQGKDGQ